MKADRTAPWRACLGASVTKPRNGTQQTVLVLVRFYFNRTFSLIFQNISYINIRSVNRYKIYST